RHVSRDPRAGDLRGPGAGRDAIELHRRSTADDSHAEALIIARAACDSRGRRHPPILTVHGMGREPQQRPAVQGNLAAMRAFVQSRSLADTHKDVAEKITAREKKYDGIVLEAI